MGRRALPGDETPPRWRILTRRRPCSPWV